MNAKRACPSMLVDESLVFELGPGALGNIRRSFIETERLSSVFISHCHADHISDLIPFLWAIQIGGRKNPLRITGPPGSTAGMHEYAGHILHFPADDYRDGTR